MPCKTRIFTRLANHLLVLWFNQITWHKHWICNNNTTRAFKTFKYNNNNSSTRTHFKIYFFRIWLQHLLIIKEIYKYTISLIKIWIISSLKFWIGLLQTFPRNYNNNMFSKTTMQCSSIWTKFRRAITNKRDLEKLLALSLGFSSNINLDLAHQILAHQVS